MLAAFLSLFYFTSAVARTGTEAERGLAHFRQCVNTTLPGWSAVRVEGLTARPRRAGRDREDASATLYFDSSGKIRAMREGPVSFKRGELVVIAGIFPWGLRVSSSSKHEAEAGAAMPPDESPAYVDVDLAFDSLDCSVVGTAWAGLFQPVEADEAQRLLSPSPASPSGIQSVDTRSDALAGGPAATTADTTGHR
jgi:hypothetical protein